MNIHFCPEGMNQNKLSFTLIQPDSISWLPSYLQGPILGLWLAVTEAGISPARICDIAQLQLSCDPIPLRVFLAFF
jgi:hypothetical protein